jgi:predicted DNA-binding mobile mystery protein A
MPRKYQKSALGQLDTSLLRYAVLRETSPPRKGWIKAVREALGMSGQQLGKRLGVSRMRVATMEQAEVTGATTLKTLRRAAEAMDCVLVYALVPRTSLKETLQKQARHKAGQDIARASRTMALEDQTLARNESDKAVESAAAALLDKMPKTLWD